MARGRGEDIGGHSASSPSIILQDRTLGAKEREMEKRAMFSQNESLLPSPFPQVINEAKRQLSCTAQPGISPSRRLTMILCAARPSSPQTWERDEERKRSRGREGGDKTGQAFSLEIITFTLLMYGQTTKDIQWQ